MKSGRHKPARVSKPQPAGNKRKNHQSSPKEQKPSATTSDQATTLGSALSPDNLLKLQNELGNQAVNRLLAKRDGSGNPAAGNPAVGLASTTGILPSWSTGPAGLLVQDTPASIQRLITSKKLERRAGKYYEDETSSSVVEAISYKHLKEALDEYHEFDEGFKRLKPDYLDHMARLDMIRQVIARAELLLGFLKFSTSERKSIVKEVHSEAIDTFVKASPNAQRAQTARKELKAKKALDKNTPARLTDDLIEMIVMSVASPIDELDVKGQAGHLGINTANNAVDALIMMQEKDFDKIKSLLEQSGDDLGEVAQKATLLKAVAARKNDLIAGGPQSEMQMFVLEWFASAIRGMDRDTMVESTHAADRGSGEGLQQRYTTSCGPTSIEIVRGEFDPIYAFGVSAEGKHSLSEGGMAADEQKEILESYRGVDKAVPRDVQNDWNTLISAVNAYVAGATWEQKLHIKRLASYLAGRTGLSALTRPGIAILKGLGTGVDIDKRLPEFRRLYAVLGKAPGMENWEFEDAAEDKLGETTGREFEETEIKYKEKLVRGKTELRGDIHKHFKKLNKALFRGDSVPFGVMWNTGGGHFMVFTDMREEKKGEKKIRYYLVSDPWHGESGWMSSTDLSKGRFTMINLPQGAIDSIFI